MLLFVVFTVTNNNNWNRSEIRAIMPSLVQQNEELGLGEREELELLRKENELFRRRVEQLETSVMSAELNSARRSEDPEMEELHNLLMKASVSRGEEGGRVYS
jgi:hypothetical protein